MKPDDENSAVDEQKVLAPDSIPKTKAEREEDIALQEYHQAAKANTAKPGQLSMKVKVHSPFRVYYDGQAYSITAKNDTGPFDVLPRHHSFITLLNSGELVIRSTDGSEQKIIISGGMMHVRSDQTIVFLDI